MFGIFGRSKYKEYQKEIMKHVDTLLFLYPRGLDKLRTDYPGIESAIQSNFKANTRECNTALYIAASVLADLIKPIKQEDRDEILQQLREFDYETFRAFLRDIMTKGDSTIQLDKNLTFGAQLFATAFMVSDDWVMSSMISKDDHMLLMSEIAGSLQGHSDSERMVQRLERALTGH